MQILRGRTTGIRSLAMSADSRYVAVGGAIVCHVWDLHDPKSKPQAVVSVRNSCVNVITDLRFTTSYNLIASVSGRWRCFDATAGYMERGDFPVLVNLISCIVYPTGTLIKTTARYGKFITYELAAGKVNGPTNIDRTSPFEYLRNFNPSGDHYLSAVGIKERLIDTLTDSVLTTFETPWSGPEDVIDCCFSPDGQRVYFNARGELLFVFDSAAGGPAITTVELPLSTWCGSLAAHPGGRLLATVEDGRAVTFRDAETLEVLRTYDFAMPTVTCVAFTPDGTRCVIGNSRGKVLLFDVD